MGGGNMVWGIGEKREGGRWRLGGNRREGGGSRREINGRN